MKAQWRTRDEDGCRRPARRCRWCGQEIPEGDAYYDLGWALCELCLPLAAPALLLPYRTIAGASEEV